MIEVENLSKRYGPTLAVSGVSFNVQKGEVLGFLGPNGAGKTTTMRVITGFFPPTVGKGSRGGLRCGGRALGGQAAHRLSSGNSSSSTRT